MKKKLESRLLGNIIRRYRKELGLTQSELASAADINESYLSAVECGYSYISMSKYLNICEGMGVDPTDILSELVEGKKKIDAEAEQLSSRRKKGPWLDISTEDKPAPEA